MTTPVDDSASYFAGASWPAQDVRASARTFAAYGDDVFQQASLHVVVALAILCVCLAGAGPGARAQVMANAQTSEKAPGVSLEHMSSVSLEQRVTIKAEAEPLRHVIRDIAGQVGFSVAFDPTVEAMSRKVWLSSGGASARELVQGLLAEAGLEGRLTRSGQLLIRSKPGVSLTPGAAAMVEVAGTVTNADGGETLPGVNVRVKGAQVGTSTNPEGRYSLDVPAGADSLVFTYVGFERKAVAIAGRSVIDVALRPAVLEGSEVVVTALGIERQEDELSYATAQVEAADIVQANATQPATALYGKIPGLRIAQNVSGGGVNLTIRGVSSITGSSRPLIVVDGIPIRDENTGYAASAYDRGRDLGTGLNDINTEDIASISVLKGGSAAALYGSEAANGAILITTKNGADARGGLGVDFTSATDFSSAIEMFNFQNEYGAGIGYAGLTGESGTGHDGEFNLNEDGLPLLPQSDYSWGPRMQGQEVMWWDGQMRSYSPQPGNYYDLYEGGINSSNTIALSKNLPETGSFRLSYTRTDRDAVVPGNEEARNSFNAAANLEVAPSLTAQFNMNYYNRTQVNPPANMYVGYDFPRSSRTELFDRYYRTEDGYNISYAQDQGRFERLTGNSARLMRDLYWKQRRNAYEVDTDHLIGSLTTTYAPLDWLSLRARVGTDLTDTGIEQRDASTRPAEMGASGRYSTSERKTRVVYGEGLATANYDLSQSVGLELMAGASLRRTRGDYALSGTSYWGGLVQENFFSVSNSGGQPRTDASRFSEATDRVFANLQLSFRDYLFLTATGSNDWTSTLPPSNNSYFYPSVGASFLFSEAFEMPSFLSYGKVRVNYAEVGRGARRYQANAVYQYGSWAGTTTNSFSTVVPPLDLQPEQQKTIEAGLNAGFLGDRLNVDASYYSQRNVDQIIDLGLAGSAGATAVTVNNGVMVNEGLELQLRATPIMTGDFQWDARINAAKNWNRIEELAAGLERLTHEVIEDNVLVESRPGGEFGALYAYDHRRGPGGRPIVDAEGFYAKSDELSYQGNVMPDLTGGIINTLRYKNLSVTAVTDVSIGGEILSMSNYYGYASGKWEETLEGRDAERGGLPYYVDEGGDWVQLPSHDAEAPGGRTVHHDGIILEGVQEVTNDQGEVTGYVENEQVVPSFQYYTTNYGWKGQGIYANAIYDNSYVKLREAAVSFEVPERFTTRLPLQNLRLSLIGRNLGYLFKNVPNIDPESALGSASALQGFEFHTWPATRSIGFRINAAF